MALRTEREALILMRDRGGNFASKLAQAWLVADPQNAARLKAGFSNLLAIYQAEPFGDTTPAQRPDICDDEREGK